jgi:Tol biopolymer transport system component
MLVVLSCGALLGVGAAPAAAKVAHEAEGSFTAEETPGGSFGDLLGLSVDNSTGPSAGDVYVGGLNTSTGSGYAYKFEANGKYAGVELNGSETPGGSFAGVSRGLAVDSSSGPNKGDVYVADAEHQVIDRFDEAGNFLCEITGKEYSTLSTVEQEHECAGSAGSKTPQAALGSAGGVAVDPVNGDVYVADTSNAVIDEFNEAGEYIGQISDSHLTSPGSIAINSSGELYVYNGSLFAGENVVKYDAGGSFAGVLTSSAAGYVAVDPSNDSVLAFEGSLFGENETAEYDSSGNVISKFGQSESGAIGVSASTGRIYLGPLLSGTVHMYGPAVVIPDVTTTEATEVKQFSATLNGEVDPAGGGEVESCQFEYVTQAHFEAEGFEAAEEAPCTPATPYAGATNVSASVSALQADTAYHFRLAASNSNGVVSDSSEQTFNTPALAVTGHATNVTASSTTLNGTVDPDGATITDCHFDYGTTTSYGEEAPCASTPSGSSPVPVHADITGLAENTTYHFRLVAAYSGGSDAGSDETLTTPGMPVIGKVYAGNLTSSSVDLNAEINPKGVDTAYHFEWGTSTSYGNSVPVPDEDIGSGTNDVLVSQHVSGLVEGTTYHWRVVATNSIGIVDGPDHTFVYQTATPSGAGCPNAQLRTNFSSSLPDCRAYEQVSPVDKNDGDVANSFGGIVNQQASVNGDRFFYEASGAAFPGAPNGLPRTQYLASRDASGWSTRAVGFPLTSIHVPGGPAGYPLPLSPDLSTDVIRAEPTLIAGAPGPDIWNLYVDHLLTGSYELVTDVNPPNQSGPNFLISFEGATADFSHVVFSANDALTPEAPWPTSFGSNLYEWVNGQLHFVGLIPTSGTTCTGAECAAAGGEELGGRNSETPELDNHAISSDGSRIVFSTGREESEKHIYDRLNGTTTVDVSASQRTPPEPGTPSAHYQDASADGFHVLFTSEGALTNDAVPASGRNLYDYNVETGQLADLTATDDARVGVLAGVSEDASHIYFTAEGVLAANSNSHGDKAVAGEPNLYLWNGGQTTFIATTFITQERQEQPTRVTPDGAQFAFNSRARLTGYDNTDVNTGEPDTEVYLYDAAANRLTCVSCNPSGARPTGVSDIRWADSVRYRPRNLTSDGSRLFFTSRDALLPGDTNGLSDVYEWEAEGSGSCQSSADNGGCLYLISSGRGATNSYFADASPSGNDVFFETGDRLVGEDEDDYADLYDARVDGGFPEPPPTASCEGESCRGEGSHAPAASGAGTAAFQGPGNRAPKHCKKGFVVRQGKCMKKKHHRKHHHNHRAANNHRRAGR